MRKFEIYTRVIVYHNLLMNQRTILNIRLKLISFIQMILILSHPLLLDQSRYLCPIVGFTNMQKPKYTTYKRKILLYNRGNYDDFRRILAENDWNSLFDSNNIDLISTRISNVILEAADSTIPNRTVTIRKNKPAWLTHDIKAALRLKTTNSTFHRLLC